MQFKNYRDMSSALAWATENRLKSLQFTDNQIDANVALTTCSAYVDLYFQDQDDEHRTIRFSDHKIEKMTTIDITEHAREMYYRLDYDGNSSLVDYWEKTGEDEYSHVEIDEELFDDMVVDAVEYLTQAGE